MRARWLAIFSGLPSLKDAGGAQVGSSSPGKDAQQGRFARAILTQQNVTTARHQVERNLAQSREAAKHARYIVELNENHPLGV